IPNASGAPIHLEIGYRSQGLGTWDYKFGDNVSQVHDFLLQMTTNFDAIDFPQGGLSATTKTKSGRGWVLAWKYSNLVTGYRIGIGPRFAFVEAALTQFIYLVLFSYAFFFKGFTGLAITIGAIITLFVVMQLTARIDWRRPTEKRAAA